MLANVNDRCSIELVYPLEAFAVDAAENQKQPANELLKGVRILSAPDEAGMFEIERGIRHVGEVCDAAFMVPYRTLCALHTHATAYDRLRDGAGMAMSRTGQIYAVANPHPGDAYEAFIDEIIVAAPRLGFRRTESPGPGDARLRGLRQ